MASTITEYSSSDLLNIFNPIFDEIRKDAAARERNRTLLFEQIGWLREKKFGALRVPVELGGYGASVVQLFDLLIQLAAADSNIPQSLRLHFSRVERIVLDSELEKQKVWIERVARGELFGNATTEAPGPAIGEVRTRVVPHADGNFRLNGRKAYGTGSLYSQWIPVVAVDHKGDRITAIVPADRPGVTLVDDWGGFGQRLTATGTTIFEDVVVYADELSEHGKRTSRSGSGFAQLVHLATLAGVAAATARDVTEKVAGRQRVYYTGPGGLPRHDPIIQTQVGKIGAAANAARSIVLGAAASIQDAWLLWNQHGEHAPATEEAYIQADLAISSAQVTLVPLVLGAATELFDALGASAIDANTGLDRHWRNARALSSHNPHLYKARVIGDYLLNGTLPPLFVAGDDVGVLPNQEAARSTEAA
ncbi:acyl-CoA dehydrogenase [Kaistia sp. 32K]|uniref:acyl-CoA dehydrogenase family protein n=1 Tax=Kaistia sp. 32K TaxID=2795690 RepID=UPI00191514E8|nr:acyl-CoA dehydrogenase family protein [Kaistia sp. 32K]BCP55500.1 acyl-CoA dehydrogenase [Kaistia sp. 32K]